ncbi:family 20 glycosylhydrolase, partial [Staphylococcus pseudintermedius]|uniref:family 20 glycosylhydrolase n=1 Tax=Staphylococcus pseudintermedius TaxID=283734 RepID=UPI000D96442B
DQYHAFDLPVMSPTKRDTLSYEEIKTLIKYSNKRYVMLVPDIDFPSHAGALLQQLKKQDKARYKTLVSDFRTNTVDYLDNQEAVKCISENLKDVMPLFEQ